MRGIPGLTLWEAVRELAEYVQCVSRGEHLARTYWLDLLIALLAIVAMLDVVLARGSSGAPTTTLWFCLPALAILVLPLFARRWFPFAGPAAYWLLAAGISFVDPLLIPYPESLFLLGAGDRIPAREPVGSSSCARPLLLPTRKTAVLVGPCFFTALVRRSACRPTVTLVPSDSMMTRVS